MVANAPQGTITDKTRVSLSLRDWLVLAGILASAVVWFESRERRHEERDRAQDSRIRDIEAVALPIKQELLPEIRAELRAIKATSDATREAVVRLEVKVNGK